VADLAGNKAWASAPPDCLDFQITETCGIRDALDPPSAGWSHSAAVGVDDWAVVAFERAHSPPAVYRSINRGRLKDASLVSPPVDVTSGTVLAFWHTFEFEPGFDGARLEISTDDGATWTDLGPAIFQGGYNGLFPLPEAPETLAPGWTGGGIGPMTLVKVSLAEHQGQGRRVRFRIYCDESVGTPGWYIDDISVCASAASVTAPPFVRGNCNSDFTVDLSDAIYLFNHLFLGGEEPVCLRACDTDGMNDVNLTDGIYLLNHLFRGGPPLPPPNNCAATLEPGPLECRIPACTSE
jgi:hypothetical protein